MPEIAYINGRFCPLAEAVVSVEDRGYQFADGVYEVVGTYGGYPYALEPHLARLQGNLSVLHLSLDIHEYGLKAKLMEGIERSGFGETLIYIQVTRGVAPRQHEFPAVPVAPTVVMTFKELRRLPRDLYDRGVEIISTEDLRWKHCDIKSIALLPNILAKQAASQAGAFEALLGRRGRSGHRRGFDQCLSRKGRAIVYRTYWPPHPAEYHQRDSSRFGPPARHTHCRRIFHAGAI